MRIRTKITLLFLGINAFILLISFILINYTQSEFRKKDFSERLHQRALATVTLYREAEKTGNTALRNTAKKSRELVLDEQVMIYDEEGIELYSSVDKLFFPVDYQLVKQIKTVGELETEIGKYDIYGMHYKMDDVSYIVVAGGYNKYGIARLNNLRFALSFIFVISLIMVTVAGWIYSGRVLSPINSVIRQVDAITVGDLAARVDEGNQKDEIARLAITFNNLLERIELAFRAQKNFVANASHELRTPLTSMSGQLELTLLKKRTTSEYEQAIRSTLEDIRYLNGICSVLLLLARAQSEKTDPDFRPLRIDELVWQIRDGALKHMTGSIIEVFFRNEPGDVSEMVIPGNEQLIRTALSNLVDNAAKFSENTPIRIGIGFDHAGVSVSVRDQGIGIAQEDLQQIFQPFYRPETTRQYSGYGLGLSMVRKIMNLHNGSVTVESEPGRGSVFTLYFPREAAEVL